MTIALLSQNKSQTECDVADFNSLSILVNYKEYLKCAF